MATITMYLTKAGKGLMCVVDGTCYYTSLSEFSKMLKHEAVACKFRTQDEFKKPLFVLQETQLV